MDAKRFVIGEGEITFESDRVVILDKFRRYLRLQIFNSSIWTIYGTASVLRYSKTNDQFLLWSGLFIGIAHIIILLSILLFRTSKSEIPIADIVSVKLKERLGNQFLDLKLKNGKIRRVSKVHAESKELKKYIETTFKTSGEG